MKKAENLLPGLLFFKNKILKYYYYYCYNYYHPELVMGHFFRTQPNPKFLDLTQPNPQKSSPDPTQPIVDTWYGILGYR